MATQKAVRLPPDRETAVVIVDADFSSGATMSSAGQGGRESSIPKGRAASVPLLIFDLLFQLLKFNLVRSKVNGDFYFFSRQLMFVFGQQRLREEKMDLRVARIDIFGVAQPILSRIEFTAIQRHDTQIIEGAAVMIIELKSGEVKSGGSSGISFRQTQIPQREICLRISGNVSASKL